MLSADFVVSGNRSAGSVVVRSSLSPISLQAARRRIDQLKAALKSAVAASTDFLMTHDVEVSLTWFVEEDVRYQTHTAADLDNVLKPLFDACAGVNGIMIDDNQVQSIKASWETPGAFGPGFELVFQSLLRDDTVTRAGTAFVEFAPNACYILPGIQPEFWVDLVSMYRIYRDKRAEMLDLGVDPSALAGLAPNTRPWHSQRLRLQGFDVLPADSFGTT